MAHKGLLVTTVEEESIAAEVGIQAGDRLLSLNGKVINDLLDYRFFVGEETLLLEVAKSNNEVWEVDIEKELDEDLGIETEEMKIRQCPNKCLFCFVDQMPEGERKALYIRDEDYRFSFLFGNYITLTNLSRKDKARIFEQKMSPLYISVHTTDEVLRKDLLENPRARPILGEIDEMIAHQIAMHTQIVLCPDLNDGAYLTKSIRDLADRHSGVLSLAIVPVGLTRHRVGLPSVKTADQAYARELIVLVDAWQNRLKKELGDPFVFAADEWYVIADVPFPPLEAYGALQQLENGIGMLPLFNETFAQSDFSEPLCAVSPIRFILVTGTSFSPFLRDCLERVKTENIHFEVVTVTNHFFGDSVTVAGLVTGGDIIDAVRERQRQQPTSGLDVLLIPDVMLAETQHSFLDSTDPEAIRKALQIPVHIVPSEAQAFISSLKTLAESPEESPLAQCHVESGLSMFK
jgi:putative radical SAM enzyme (TIGR03279 family)